MYILINGIQQIKCFRTSGSRKRDVITNHEVNEFKASNLIFLDPESGSIPGAGKVKNFTYKRVNISTKSSPGLENSSPTLYPKLIQERRQIHWTSWERCLMYSRL